MMVVVVWVASMMGIVLVQGLVNVLVVRMRGQCRRSRCGQRTDNTAASNGGGDGICVVAAADAAIDVFTIGVCGVAVDGETIAVVDVLLWLAVAVAVVATFGLAVLIIRTFCVAALHIREEMSYSNKQPRQHNHNHTHRAAAPCCSIHMGLSIIQTPA